MGPATSTAVFLDSLVHLAPVKLGQACFRSGRVGPAPGRAGKVAQPDDPERTCASICACAILWRTVASAAGASVAGKGGEPPPTARPRKRAGLGPARRVRKPEPRSWPIFQPAPGSPTRSRSSTFAPVRKISPNLAGRPVILADGPDLDAGADACRRERREIPLWASAAGSVRASRKLLSA